MPRLMACDNIYGSSQSTPGDKMMKKDMAEYANSLRKDME